MKLFHKGHLFFQSCFLLGAEPRKGDLFSGSCVFFYDLERFLYFNQFRLDFLFRRRFVGERYFCRNDACDDDQKKERTGKQNFLQGDLFFFFLFRTVLKLGKEIAGILEAIIFVAAGFEDDLVQVTAQGVVDHLRRDGRELFDRIPREGAVEDFPQRIKVVRNVICGGVSGLEPFRWDESQRTSEGDSLFRGTHQPHIGKFRCAVDVKNIFRLQIPVDHARFMQRPERAQHGCGKLHDFRDRQAFGAFQPLRQRFRHITALTVKTVRQFHGVEEAVLQFSQMKDPDQVGRFRQLGVVDQPFKFPVTRL